MWFLFSFCYSYNLRPLWAAKITFLPTTKGTASGRFNDFDTYLPATDGKVS